MTREITVTKTATCWMVLDIEDDVIMSRNHIPLSGGVWTHISGQVFTLNDFGVLGVVPKARQLPAGHAYILEE